MDLIFGDLSQGFYFLLDLMTRILKLYLACTYIAIIIHRCRLFNAVLQRRQYKYIGATYIPTSFWKCFFFGGFSLYNGAIYRQENKVCCLFRSSEAMAQTLYGCFCVRGCKTSLHFLFELTLSKSQKNVLREHV